MCKKEVRSTFTRHLKKFSIEIHWKEASNRNSKSHKCRKKIEGCAIVNDLLVNGLESKLKLLQSMVNAYSISALPANESVSNDFTFSMSDFDPLPTFNPVDDFDGIGQPNAPSDVGHGLDNISTSSLILGSFVNANNPHHQSYQNPNISANVDEQDFMNDNNAVATSLFIKK